MADEEDDDILDSEEPEEKSKDDAELETEAEQDEKPEGEPIPEENEDKDTEKEIEDSEDTGKEESDKKSEAEEIADESDDLKGPLPKEETAQAPPSKLDRYQEFINQYRKLQDNRKQGDLVSGLMAAGAKIGQSMAGKYSGNFTPDLTGSKMVQEMYNRPVTDLEQQQVVQGRGMALQSTMQANDPASPQSKMVRDYLNKRMFADNPLPDTVSASDAQMLLKSAGRPLQTKFQKVNGSYTDEQGTSHRISASFDPQSHTYIDVNGNKLPDNFVAEGLNPFQIVKGEHGEQEQYNKSRGGAPVPIKNGPSPDKAQDPVQLYATLQPDERKVLDTQLKPAFNKETEKTRQRLTHVPVIMQRLQEAQTNPAALPQLKAELARFDVGDQRLAAQEFNMFGQRMGYKGAKDWLEAHSTGTISKDFADSMGQAITNVSNDLKGELNDKAEEQGNLLSQRTKADPKIAAKLIYGGYTTPEPKVRVRNLKTGQEGYIPKKNLQKAIASKKYQEIP